MRFATKLSSRDRTRVESALPTVLRAGESPIFAVTCTHVRRAQQFLLITDQRLVGLALDGRVRHELNLGPDVTGHRVNDFSTLIITTRTGEEKLGTLVHSDVDEVRSALDAALAGHRPPGHPLAQPAATGQANHAEHEGHWAGDEPPARGTRAASEGLSLAEQLDHLSALHERGALTDEQFEAAKGAILGTVPPSPTQPIDPREGKYPESHARGHRKKITEVERTCSRDGTVWFVPIELTRVHKPMRFSLGMVEFGDVMLGGGGAASQQLTREEAAWARAQAARQCPQCGSQAFHERKVRH